MQAPVLRSPDEARVQIALDAVCHDCKHRHKLGLTPQGFTGELWEWQAKHADHDFEFLSTKRHLPRRFRDWMFQKAGLAPWWLWYKENANIKIEYASSAALTCSLQTGPLASSATFVVGREATAIVNTSNKYVDYRVTAKITTGTTPTADKEIRIYAYAVLNDTPVYPDTITGTDSTVTLTSTYILDSGFTLIGATSNSATTAVAYYPRCITIAEAFGHCPTRWGLYVSHSTGVALHATAGNHVLSQIGAYFTSV